MKSLEGVKRPGAPCPGAGAFARTAVALAVVGLGTAAQAVEIETGNDDLKVRWDNTVKASMGYRLKEASAALLANPNNDDGNRNFAKGVVSSRLDLFSELDVIYQKNMGMRLSAAGWYDSEYMGGNSNPGFAGGAFPNQTSVPFNRFTEATRDVHGRDVELLDAFLFGKFDLAGYATTVRAGRHSLLWGESLFFGGNAISGAQMPVDVVKLLSVPGTQFKEAIRPVPMVSAQSQISANMSVGAYVQTSASQSRVAAVGSYFSNADPAVEGGENLLLGPGAMAARLPDQKARNSGQGGVQLKVRGEEADFGFYAIQFHSKAPQLVPVLGMTPVGPAPMGYRMAYHENIKALGASMSKTFGDYNVAIEGSVRNNQDLASTQGADVSAFTPAPATNNSSNPGYAVGRTAHLNVSVLGNLPSTPLWKEASLVAEVAWNRVLKVTKNAAAADPNATRNGLAFRLQVEPMYRQVVQGVDLSVPIGLGYAPKGSRPLAMSNPNAWIPEGGGDISVGLNATYLDALRFGLNYTHYFGTAKTFNTGANNAFGWGQTFKDRDFISITARYTF